jgi:hypothetical protein
MLIDLASTYGATAAVGHRQLAPAVRRELDSSCASDQLGKHKGNGDGKGQESRKHAQCTLAVAKDRH